MLKKYISSNQLRSNFAKNLSNMYKKEVPLYGKLVSLVEKVNKQTLQDSPYIATKLAEYEDLARISNERHGAIRLASPFELKIIRRIFRVFGMYPVGYYDLSVSSMPVHSTAFRPITRNALSINPFRVFTSLLRLDLIKDIKLRQKAKEIIANRKIFTNSALELLDQAEKNGGLDEVSGDRFILEVMETFRWHSLAKVSYETYQSLLQSHRLIADILSFKGPHINHLTPRTLDIDLVQELMPKHDIDAKAVIEGPPNRKCPILLRQTSFKALSEKISFDKQTKDSKQQELIESRHTARFGEIEQRGIALTKKGRALYDRLLNQVLEICRPKVDGSNKQQYLDVLVKVFKQFPDDYETLRSEKLAFFHYNTLDNQNLDEDSSNLNIDEAKSKLDNLIAKGKISYHPVTYEDFLPVSAAGIFESNLSEDDREQFQFSPNQSSFEQALGEKVYDEFHLYDEIERNSIAQLFNLDKVE